MWRKRSRHRSVALPHNAAALDVGRLLRIPRCGQPSQVARAHDVQHAITVTNDERPGGASARVAAARFARPQFGTGLLLEHPQPARMVWMWLRVQKHFDVLDAEAELGDARHDHRGGARIAAIEHDVTLGPGDEEGRGIRRANVVQVAGDAERFGGELPNIDALTS